jgi:sugar lactone lactonase YvrE
MKRMVHHCYLLMAATFLYSCSSLQELLPNLSVDKTVLNEPSFACRDSILITSNTSWNISGQPAWISAYPATGDGNATVYLNFTANTGSAPRQAILKINGVGAAANPAITINQENGTALPLSITSFDAHAPGGSSITIQGSGFATIPSQNTVKINGVLATVTAATTNALTVTVPPKAGSGNITVAVGSSTATSSTPFTYDWVYQVTTLAGSLAGNADGPYASATFNYPVGLHIDQHNILYVADYQNHRIRKFNDQVITWAGNTSGFKDGNGTAALFKNPYSITSDANGNLYVADFFNFAIRKIDAFANVTTLAGGSQGFLNANGTAAKFGGPTGVVIDAKGFIFVADFNNNAIRLITPDGEVTTRAGGTQGTADGFYNQAQFNGPTKIITDNKGSFYITDRGNNRIRKMTWDGVVSTLAGSTAGFKDDNGISARFNAPNGLAVDAGGNIYVADRDNHAIRMISPSGQVTTIAGGQQGFADGTGTLARFNSPNDVAVDAQGNIYVADAGNNRIRKITPQ